MSIFNSAVKKVEELIGINSGNESPDVNKKETAIFSEIKTAESKSTAKQSQEEEYIEGSEKYEKMLNAVKTAIESGAARELLNAMNDTNASQFPKNQKQSSSQGRKTE